MIRRLRVWLARKLLPAGWAVFENRSSLRDDFAGEFRSILTDPRATLPTSGFFEQPPSIAHHPSDDDVIQEQEREASDLQVRDDGG